MDPNELYEEKLENLYSYSKNNSKYERIIGTLERSGNKSHAYALIKIM